jgi:hypothetical protein
MTPDDPTAYVGQPRKHESDDYSTWFDPSNTGVPNKDRASMDAIDPERPSGGSRQLPSPRPPNKTRVKWFNAKRKK